MTAPALGTDLAVSRATAAARRGDLDGAAQILAALESDEPVTLDLLARIRAQQGRWREADECWATVQAIDPGHEGAAAGRRAVAAILAGDRRPRPVAPPVRLAAAGAVVTVALAAGTVVVLSSLPASPPTKPAASTGTPTPDTAALDAERRRAAELQGRLQQIEADRAAAAQALSARLDAIARGVTLPGVVVKRRPDTVEVYFRKGLFSRDAWLTTNGAEMLAVVGRRLPDLDVAVTVVGHSVPVPGGRTSGGSGTALTRARVAARELAEAGDLPLTAFTLRSADQSQGPFREPARNRTASLVLTPS
ncbi:tetratricopeptide repeat protein [Plantactinospora sp. CA-294935]|uniref:tetratricopeptide repeat protein n=1 Tax=Plantactinospora sp. CA-294935 TaxID=3240012 RepID=UPI003D8BB1CF